MRRTVPALAVTTLILAACGGETGPTTSAPPGGSSPPPSTTTSPPDTTVAPTTTPSSSTTTVATTSLPPGTTRPPVAGEITILLPSVAEMSEAWTELFTIPYGESAEQLGTAPGGDGGSLDLGPEYGAAAPDGTWWFLDAAKRRVAHYSADGKYLDEVPLQPGHLVNGELFQWQLPRVLDDGTLVASRLGTEVSTLFVLEDGAIKLISVEGGFGVRYDDGTKLYGFSGETNALTEVDPKTGTPTSVDWFYTRAGTRFRLEVRGDLVTVELPDAASAPTLPLRLAYAADPSIPAYGLVEVASGLDGTLFIYIIGGTDTGDGGQLAGFLTISPEGVVSPVETTRNPFPPSDPGSPGHLGVQPGISRPWIMFIDTDGVRVFARGIRS